MFYFNFYYRDPNFRRQSVPVSHRVPLNRRNRSPTSDYVTEESIDNRNYDRRRVTSYVPGYYDSRNVRIHPYEQQNRSTRLPMVNGTVEWVGNVAVPVVILEQ